MKELTLKLPYQDFSRGIWNPSIVKVGQKISGIARIRKSEHSNNRVAILFDLDEKFNARNIRSARWSHSGPDVYPEDFRFFEFGGQLYCSHSIRVEEKMHRMGISKVDLSSDSIQLLGLVTVKDYDFSTHEKNWVFYEREGQLFGIINVCPRLVILELENFNRLEFKIRSRASGQALYDFLDPRNYVSVSTAPVSLDSQHDLMIIHQAKFGIRGRWINYENSTQNNSDNHAEDRRYHLSIHSRVYSHYAIRLNHTSGRIYAIARQPILRKAHGAGPGRGITFVMSGFFDQSTKSFVYSFGERNKESRLLFLTKGEVENQDWIGVRSVAGV